MDFSDLPLEILIKIFNYLPHSIIKLSQVCKYFHTIATNQIKNLCVILSEESEGEIQEISESLKHFKSVRTLKVELSVDVNIQEKADFCNEHRTLLTELVLKDFSFLNPFFDEKVYYEKLHKICIKNSDLQSCSQELPEFILSSCPNLKSLIFDGCSGFEIDALNNMGHALNCTKIESFQLSPTYSYFDMTANLNDIWTIENLETLSIRSKLVVMKKNFVKNMFGNKTCSKLKTLELIAEVNFGENLIPVIIQKFANLESLSLGKGVSIISNQDFVTICNHYKNLKKLEFHFDAQDNAIDLKRLRENLSLIDLTLGISNISVENVKIMSQCFPNLKKINIILYQLSNNSKDYVNQLISVFEKIVLLQIHQTGITENITLFL
jgi:F-box-like